MAGNTRMQQRRATKAVWDASGYVLDPGELGVETDTGIIKFGNGVTAWVDLPAAFASAYLPTLGKAADSELLDGMSAASFLQASDATTAATADKLALRTTGGRLKVGTATESDDATTLTQTTSAISSAISTAQSGPIATDIATAKADAIVTAKQEPYGGFLAHADPFTISLANVGKLFLVENTSLTAQKAVTVPANSTAAIPIGSFVDVVATGVGGLLITPAGGVTLRGIRNVFPNYGAVRLLKFLTNEWIIFGLNKQIPGRLPRMRIVRTGATGYTNGSYIAVPYDSISAVDSDVHNPDSEWFTATSLSTERRVVVKKDGEYLITVNFISTVTATTYTRIVKMTAANTPGATIASQSGNGVCAITAQARLTANDSIGATHLTASGGDLADGNNGNRHDLTIVRLSD